MAISSAQLDWLSWCLRHDVPVERPVDIDEGRWEGMLKSAAEYDGINELYQIVAHYVFNDFPLHRPGGVDPAYWESMIAAAKRAKEQGDAVPELE